MALKFGTSGIRGLVSEFTDQEIYWLVSAFLKHADSIQPTINVTTAMDLRGSSPEILNAVHKALFDHNKTILDCGVTPTPCLAYFAKEKKSLAIMITGSHIPADRNGIKFYLESGETLKKDDQLIYDYYLKLKSEKFKSEIFNSLGAFKNPQRIHFQDRQTECENFFLQRYGDFFGPGRLKNMKILFYEHSSAARNLIPTVLQNLGAQVIKIGFSKEFIPVDTEAVESVHLFQKWIKDHQAQALVSTDGDGDRPLVIDNLGRVVPGDKIGILTSQLLGVKGVALPISCNSAISEMPDFQDVVFTKIGSPYVVEALDQLTKKGNSCAGFEANGGYILNSEIFSNSISLKPLPTRDSILPILSVLATCMDNKKSLSEIVDKLPPRYTSSILVKNCAPSISEILLKELSLNPNRLLQKILTFPTENSLNFERSSKDMVNSDFSINEINSLDGIRFTLANKDILHFRPSGNAPEFRCYTESNTQEQADLLAKKSLNFLQSWVQSHSEKGLST